MHCFKLNMMVELDVVSQIIDVWNIFVGHTHIWALIPVSKIILAERRRKLVMFLFMESKLLQPGPYNTLGKKKKLLF